ncbi:hypothetical protein [Nannocystis pusilla]|uniref:hypothetical protein n=1 Tax=Nannocystis pusilla TaxID=889268 RepID=UPI003B7EB164
MAARIAGLDVSAPGREPFKLFYANGPIFTPVAVEGLAPYVSLATFIGEIYNMSKGTGPGEMPGTPAITASQFGKGRVLLFSPNPILGGRGVVQEDLMLSGLRWVATAGTSRRTSASPTCSAAEAGGRLASARSRMHGAV